jgi:hypothetical protein
MPATQRKQPAKRARKTAGVVDAALKARWQETSERYRAATARESAGLDERFEALGEILEKRLYLAGGYRSENAFLRAEAPDLDRRTAKTNVRVAKYFTPEDVARYGVTKLDLLLDHLDARGGAPIAPARLRPDRQVIVIPERGRDRRVAFANVTVQALKLATRTARRAAGGAEPRSRSPVVQLLTRELARVRLGMVGVSVRRGALAFSNVPEDRLAAFAKALKKVAEG